ncbi:ABC transporter ATP-binding protein [Nocardioides gilvus]|uniref:ABC transporter ATP-binding protein n=1 Tax=Nocardioides gilvus TaxID=1735589 RepID=UPI000D74DC0E|nr:ATP-binding cassette domain-containing protein [Nocardioides gilvus]
MEFRNVGKTYRDGTVAVADFSHVVASHRIAALVGSSGSGKTTLLRMVNRMIDPSNGTVLIDDEDIQGLDKVRLRRRIGYVPQAGGLLPHRTVVDNVATVPVLNGTSRATARGNALDLLTLVGLDASLASRYPAQLSGGQQQRVAVARALAADPNILLMDEPFGAVDPIVRRELQDQLLRVQAELGKTIVIVTHDVDEAFRLADDVVVLRTGGVVAQSGTPQSILASPADAFVRDFVGADRPERTLTTTEVDGQRLVVDADGRPVGILR